jgi:hypothetical protein
LDTPVFGTALVHDIEILFKRQRVAGRLVLWLSSLDLPVDSCTSLTKYVRPHYSVTAQENRKKKLGRPKGNQEGAKEGFRVSDGHDGHDATKRRRVRMSD